MSIEREIRNRLEAKLFASTLPREPPTNRQTLATVKPAEAPQPQCRIPKDGEIVLSDDEYQELKRLAEIAWAALLSSPTDGKAKWFAEFSWNAAEAMHAEFERRRPK